MPGDEPREEIDETPPGCAVLLGVVPGKELRLVYLRQPAPRVEVGGVPIEGLEKGSRTGLERSGKCQL